MQTMEKQDLIRELQWRGLIKDIMPGTEEQLRKESTTGYIGFDPTSDSLHIGSLLPITLLMRMQKAGHKPLALVGGATGMVGDPSGKSEERNLLDEETINRNLRGIQRQLEKFLDFSGENAAGIVNNHDWFKNMGFLEFIRDIGKHITVNYMMAKDSVQKRLETGLSFTEFTYQLVQGYDFYYLYKEKNCKLQMGGSDQWGNMVTGTELIRRKAGGEAFALTCPLVTKPDGSKFGKTEEGNVWLDPEKTSPYKFYQFWLNVSDEEASRYLRIFTFYTQKEIEELEIRHNEAPHLRTLQHALADDLTTLVHSRDDLEGAIRASEILFGKTAGQTLPKLTERELLEVFEGVPQYEVSRGELEAGIPIIDLLAEKTSIATSKGDARRAMKEGAISLNKNKMLDDLVTITEQDLLNNKYLLVQKGKKNYYLILAV